MIVLGTYLYMVGWKALSMDYARTNTTEVAWFGV